MQQEWMGGATREDGQVPLDGFLRMMHAMKMHGALLHLGTLAPAHQCTRAPLHPGTFEGSCIPGMKSGSNQLHAMADPLCLLHYPMVTKRYWWSIVMLVRPTIIAAMYNARDRGSGLIQVPPATAHSARTAVTAANR